jgi:hypothetical protein
MLLNVRLSADSISSALTKNLVGNPEAPNALHQLSDVGRSWGLVMISAPSSRPLSSSQILSVWSLGAWQHCFLGFLRKK